MSEIAIEIESLSFTYPDRSHSALEAVNLSIHEAEFILLAGPTGCGKSTLLKCLNGLIPHASAGNRIGSVSVFGKRVIDLTLNQICESVGTVFQNPDDQIISTTVEDEVAFGLENLAVDRAEMIERIQWSLEMVGLQDRITDRIHELSGGMKQRLAIASVIAMQPRILLLDEPTSQLDPQGTKEVLETIVRLREELGTTIVIVEHQLDKVAEICDRLVLLHEGKILLDASVPEAFEDLAPFRNLGMRIPLDSSRPPESITAPTLANPKPPLVILSGIRFRYQTDGADILKNIDLQIFPGERIALMGLNGSGKSTLLWILAGLLQPVNGSIYFDGDDTRKKLKPIRPGKVGLLLQNSDLMLHSITVKKEIAFGPKQIRMPNAEQRVEDTLDVMNLSSVAEYSPLALSRGQRHRTALGSILSMSPSLVLLDEPTTGQDGLGIENMMNYLKRSISRSENRSLLFSTHDIHVATKYASKIILLSQGRILKEGRPEEVFSEPDLVL